MKKLMLLIAFTIIAVGAFAQQESEIYPEFQFTAQEQATVDSLIARIPADSVFKLNDLYIKWTESINTPELMIQSNTEAYKTAEFQTFKAYALSLGPCYIGAIIELYKKYGYGVAHYIILDVPYCDYSEFIKAAHNRVDSIKAVKYTHISYFDNNCMAYSYFKIILADIQTNNQKIINNAVRVLQLNHGFSTQLSSNLVKNTLNIIMHNNSAGKLNIYNSSGQLVQTTQLYLGSNSINVQRFKPGLYFSHVSAGSGTTLEKFIIQ